MSSPVAGSASAEPQVRGFSPAPVVNHRFSLSRQTAAGLSAALAVLGVFAISSTAVYLYGLWTTDPLKSIGGLIPLVSFLLILRAWRSLGWEMDGTWWGFVLLAATVVAVHIRDHAIVEFILGPSWAIFLPPHSLVAFCYAAGAVLLFGGVRLFRTALFPVVLTWFVNPVPNAFNLLVDLPLQHASAKIARAFAHMMGQPLTQDQLRLMFTPDFGMFIAPGCNGIRGAITMGFIALIAGYIYKFQMRYRVLTVIGAVLLGYLFNLIRLCVLVLYYIVALHIHWLQSRAEMGDYVIGACLFLVATTLLFTVIFRLSPTGSLRLPPLSEQPGLAGERVPRSWLPRFVAFAALAILGSVSYARAWAERDPGQAVRNPEALGHFPQHVGGYTLAREWNEYLVAGGPLIFYWADYAPDHPRPDQVEGGGRVSVGISPVLGAHDTLLCHSARGEDWLWHDALVLPTAVAPTSFSGTFYNDGATQYMEATTVCTGGSCGQYATPRQHFGFVYSHPDTHTLLTQSPDRPIPVLLRTETTDTAMAPDLARKELTANLSDFLTAANLATFARAEHESAATR